jgi:D-cysteine desulfhydrase
MNPSIAEPEQISDDAEEHVREAPTLDFSRFPRRGYLQGPTPLEEMKNLGKALGGEVNLFVKRDDLLPGASGGNKTRKLDFCIAEALANGADTIVTCGAVQSNHCRLTAAWCAKEELDCHLVLEERVKGSYKEDGSGNLFLFDLLDVKSKRVVPGGSNMMAEMETTAEELRSQGKKPFIIPGGASTPVGALGYAECAQEIVNQLDKMGLQVDNIVLASGSSGTHAGMIAGLTGLQSAMKIHGINTSRPKDAQEALVYNLAEKTARLLGHVVDKADIHCYDDFVGPGYSLPTDGMIEAVKLFAKTEGILLDPVYTGKAAAGLIDLVRSGTFAKGSNVLFLHTGGSPVLYAYLNDFRKGAN